MQPLDNDPRGSYDSIAEEYTQRLYHELDHKPFDRKMLDLLADKVGNHGIICDLGCGPGQIARYLQDYGAKTCGIDLSEEMVRQAQKLNPEIAFQQGDMLALTDIADWSYAGIAAFYSIIHVPTEAVSTALREMGRVLQPSGILLLTFHIGQEVRHFDELWDTPVSLDFYFFEREEMKGYLIDAGFALDEAIERDPYPEVEVQTRRAYLFARKM